MSEVGNEYQPFEVRFVNGASYGSPEQVYQILADFDSPHLASYRQLFAEHGDAQSPVSLVDIAALIIEENADVLLDCMDFNEEEYQLDMHVDSEEALQKFALVICLIYRNFDLLKSYTKQVVEKKKQ